MNPTAYWRERKHFDYYKIVKDMIRERPGDSIVDVGAWETPIVLAGKFRRRVAVDRRPIQSAYNDVEYYVEDFLTWQGSGFDLVVCLQVLEHLDDRSVVAFARKLLRTGKTTIISVPYQWDPSYVETHLQDPVDEAKLKTWMGREPDHSIIVVDDLPRLICAYVNQS